MFTSLLTALKQLVSPQNPESKKPVPKKKYPLKLYGYNLSPHHPEGTRKGGRFLLFLQEDINQNKDPVQMLHTY